MKNNSIQIKEKTIDKQNRPMALQQSQQSIGFASAFIIRLEELLTVLREAFPECAKVTKAHKDFLDLVKANQALHDFIVRKWHGDMEAYYDIIRDRQVEKLLEAKVPLLEKLDMATKWKDPTFDSESREVLFVYLEQLNSYANIHCSVPGKMMSKIESTAMKVVSDIQSNTFDPASFNVQEITKSLMENLSADDLNQFAEGIPRLQSTFQSLIGNDMSSLAGMANMPGMNFNFASLASMFGQPQQPPS